MANPLRGACVVWNDDDIFVEAVNCVGWSGVKNVLDWGGGVWEVGCMGVMYGSGEVGEEW